MSTCASVGSFIESKTLAVQTSHIGFTFKVSGYLVVHMGPGVEMFVGCLTSQQQASVCQGRICSDNLTCCHIEAEAADRTFYLTQSQYTDTGPTSPSTDPITPGVWQGSHWSANFWVTGMTRPGKIPSPAGFEPEILRSRGGRLNHYANEAVGVKRRWVCLQVV